MKNFWKDYYQLWKDTGKFCKKHWFGVILMNAGLLAAETVYFERHYIKSKIEEKFSKKEES